MKKIMFFIIAISLLLLISNIPVRPPIHATQSQRDLAPILDANVIPGVYLYFNGFICEDTPWSENTQNIMEHYKSLGIDIEKFKAPSILGCEESWYSETKETMIKMIPKKRSECPDYWCVTIRREYLKSKEGAIEYAKTDVRDHLFMEGSPSGGPIGDKCWRGRSSSPTIIFVKGNIYVYLTVSRIHSEVSADCIENVARIVEKRL